MARQWNGRGKVDTCQVGVYAALSCGRCSSLIDTQLYLPSSWMENKARCAAVGLPTSARRAKSKPELTLEMVRYKRRLGVRFSWVRMDGFYGNDPTLLKSLESDGDALVADLHKDQHFYLEDPQLIVPAPRLGRGRKRTKRVARSEAVRVDESLKTQPASAWTRLKLCASTKGELRVEVLCGRVWLWDGKKAPARHGHLFVRREINASDGIKYSLSNASANTSIERLAQLQGQRYWVEPSFQDGKSQPGLDHYQAFAWRASHHHMTSVMTGLLFTRKQRIEHLDEFPLLSCVEIETLLAYFLPRRGVGVDEVIRQMEVRHQQRHASIDLAYAKQQLE